MMKREVKKETLKALFLLRKLYPHLFTKPVKVFKIGIKEDITANIEGKLPKGITIENIHDALTLHCRSKPYLEVRDKLGSPRVDILGNVVAEVTQKEVSYGKFLKIQRIQRMKNRVVKPGPQKPGQKKFIKKSVRPQTAKTTKPTVVVKKRKVYEK